MEGDWGNRRQDCDLRFYIPRHLIEESKNYFCREISMIESMKLRSGRSEFVIEGKKFGWLK